MVAGSLAAVGLLGVLAVSLPHHRVALARRVAVASLARGTPPVRMARGQTSTPGATSIGVGAGADVVAESMAEAVAEAVADAVVLGASPPRRDVTAALWKAEQFQDAAPVHLVAGSVSVSKVGTDRSDQLFEVVVTPALSTPVPVDVVIAISDGRPVVTALPGLAG